MSFTGYGGAFREPARDGRAGGGQEAAIRSRGRRVRAREDQTSAPDAASGKPGRPRRRGMTRLDQLNPMQRYLVHEFVEDY